MDRQDNEDVLVESLIESANIAISAMAEVSLEDINRMMK